MLRRASEKLLGALKVASNVEGTFAYQNVGVARFGSHVDCAVSYERAPMAKDKLVTLYIVDYNGANRHVVKAMPGEYLANVLNRHNLIPRKFKLQKEMFLYDTHVILPQEMFARQRPLDHMTEEYAWLWRLARGLTPQSRMASQVVITKEDNDMAIGLAPTHEYVPGSTPLAKDNDVLRDLGVIDEEAAQRGYTETEGVKFRFTWR